MDIQDQDARELRELLSSPVCLPDYWNDTLVQRRVAFILNGNSELLPPWPNDMLLH
jgi:hypothetical protein